MFAPYDCVIKIRIGPIHVLRHRSVDVQLNISIILLVNTNYCENASYVLNIERVYGARGCSLRLSFRARIISKYCRKST